MKKMSSETMRNLNGGDWYCHKCGYSNGSYTKVYSHIALNHISAWNIFTCWLGWKY